MSQWSFMSVGKGHVVNDPFEIEFFRRESLVDSFVRQAIQNTLDAAINGGPVECRIKFCSGADALKSADASRYFQGLAVHLQAEEVTLPVPAHVDRPVNFLLFEDFGTRGLEGSPDQSRDESLSVGKNHFYYFWRNVGRGQKSGTDLGRWGLGKLVFPAASQINCFFGLTVRASDRSRLLMGQSVLKIHRVGEHWHGAYGYFGTHAEDGFALPLGDAEALHDFCRAFRLERTPDQPGLSVVIPLPDQSLTADGIVSSVVRHYFYPVLAGKLTVTVVANGTAQVLDRAFLLEFDRNLKSGSQGSSDPKLGLVGGMIDLASWAISQPESARVELKLAGQGKAPKWGADLFPGTLLKEIAERLDREERVALRVPIMVKPKGKTPQASAFDVFLERDESLPKSDEAFVRKGITVSEIKSLNTRGLRGLVVISDAALAGFLGDAENPAHTEWQERSPKFKNKYDHDASTLRFVKNCLREIVQLTSNSSAATDTKALRHLFYIDAPPEQGDPAKEKQPKPDTKATATDTVNPDIDDIESHAVPFRLVRVDDGFRIAGPATATDLPPQINVQVAYDVRSGNAFKKYMPFDFEMDKAPIRVRATGATVFEAALNRLCIVPTAPGFEVEVLGFGATRDILIEAKVGERTDATEI